YILADFTAIRKMPADEFARWLTIEGGVATVPGTSFFADPAMGRDYTRFAFCKTEEFLQQAVARLEKLAR
ncbi:MAG: aminotransferase, partial [Gemmatimonadetes bacterium]|nr:aminotransferase [Gemmatimonadota bacterium]